MKIIYQVWFKQSGCNAELVGTYTSKMDADKAVSRHNMYVGVNECTGVKGAWIVEVRESTGADALNRIFG
jgi:hypothetical protein